MSKDCMLRYPVILDKSLLTKTEEEDIVKIYFQRYGGTYNTAETTID